MFRPEHVARVENQDFFFGGGVEDDLLVRFVAVAMKTSERQVFNILVAAHGTGKDVVNGEGDKLPMFVSMAVLA